jgi:hypothetical protein
MPMRLIFKEQEDNLSFERDGYKILSALDADTVRQMENFFLTNSEQNFTGWHNSLELNSPEQKAKIYDFLAQVFVNHLSGYFNDYRIIAATFVSKKSDEGSAVHLHQDWSFVNEADYASLNLWIPLCETTAENGALTILKGSHRIKSNLRGSNIPSSIKFPHRLAAKYLTTIQMRRGEVFAYDHRLIHGSGSNRSGRPRTAASLSVIPAESTPIHYLLANNEAVELEVDAEFYHHCRVEMATAADPVIRYSLTTGGYRNLKIAYTEVKITDEDIRDLYEPGAAGALRQFKDKLKAAILFR